MSVATPVTTATTAPATSALDGNVIVVVAICIGALFVVILIAFIIFVVYFYRKHLNDGEFGRKPPPLKNNKLEWKANTLEQQFANLDDVDGVIWTEGGRKPHSQTANPAFGKDLDSLDADSLDNFSITDRANSAHETESTSDMVEINLDDDSPKEDTGGQLPNGTSKQISILDMNTWGQPGISRNNSMMSLHGVGLAYGNGLMRSGGDEPAEESGFPYLDPNNSIGRQSSVMSVEDAPSPVTVSQPLTDPRFEYTRTNPLILPGEVRARSLVNDVFPFVTGRSTEDYSSNYGTLERDFGGKDAEDDGSTSMRSGHRQSVVDFYESGMHPYRSDSFNLALNGGNSMGEKKLLWQTKNFGVAGKGIKTKAASEQKKKKNTDKQ